MQAVCVCAHACVCTAVSIMTALGCKWIWASGPAGGGQSRLSEPNKVSKCFATFVPTPLHTVQLNLPERIRWQMCVIVW